MSTHECPLCSKTHEDRTDLHVHLEITHRKSEIVSYLVDSLTETGDTATDGEVAALEDEPATPPV
ncbi:hypothetical protein CV102_24145 [Natronococcus pandeyae]|uniref:C2H2-type domain-containing protein n=1 Tax=Natronococcus pandeyae TaxID=2055836 RepID=A0A8J8TMZ4_9EURY|nr:hypothetical protein [Natronococcus pandeyae]TYL36126.1 hypothetical protein CV102_24145 [Natronococcus pandeyae]